MTFTEFWTNANNPILPKSEYLYGTNHIIVLVVTVIACIALTLLFYKRSQKTKRILFCTIGGIMLFLELASRIVNLIILDEWTFATVAEKILPMYICSVMVWVFIFAIFTKNQLLIDFGVIGGLLATLAFLLFPATGLNKANMTFTCLYSIISHMLGFICAINLITLKQVKFDMKKIWQMYICFAVMFLWGVLLTFVIFPGSDYMFLVKDPLELSLGFPYQILYGILLAVYIFAFYFVSWLSSRISASRPQNRPLIKVDK